MKSAPVDQTQNAIVETWKTDLARAVTSDAPVKNLATQLLTLDALNLEPTAKVRLLVETLNGAGRADTVSAKEMRPRANLVGDGLVHALSAAKTVIAEHNDALKDQGALSKQMKTIARGEVPQLLAAYLRATNPREISAMVIASSDGDLAKSLLLTSKAVFMVKSRSASEESIWDYSAPTTYQLNELGITTATLTALLEKKLAEVGDGRKPECDSLQDLGLWRSFFQSNIVHQSAVSKAAPNAA